MMKTAFTKLLKLIIGGLIVGALLGIILGFGLYFDAVRKAPELQKANGWRGDEVQSYLCAAGQAPMALGILGIPIGACLGLVTGIILLIRRKRRTLHPQIEAVRSSIE